MTTITEFGWMEGPWMIGEWMAPLVYASTGMQADVLDRQAMGIEVEADSTDTKVMGIQVDGQILDASGAFGMEVNEVHHVHKSCAGWMEGPWMEDPWMTGIWCVVLGVQVEASGFKVMGIQVNSKIYNTNNLRILCEFLSRGVTGNNWTATSTETGDFLPVNLNSDLVEQAWRSTSTVTQILTCNAQTGILVDTIALLEHNISNGGAVTLQASPDAGFSSIELNVTMQITQDNMYWLAEDLPLTAWQYWRFIIDDAANADGYIQVGTIVFGSAAIFNRECFVDDIGFAYKDFADKVNTEGFTNISNSRAIKKTLDLTFRTIDSFGDNFEIIRDLTTIYRTTHKCLWIPTPDFNDQKTTARYAMFSKLVSLPRERHKSPDNDIDYATFDIDLDESL